MILADSSIVIGYARGKDAKLARLIPKHPIAVCGIVRAELLCGARDPGHRRNLLSFLATFAQISMPESLWNIVGDNLAALRRRGLTIPFPDVAVAALGILNDIEVWSRSSFCAYADGSSATQALPGAAVMEEALPEWWKPASVLLDRVRA